MGGGARAGSGKREQVALQCFGLWFVASVAAHLAFCFLLCTA